MKRIDIMLLSIFAAFIILAGVITLDKHNAEHKSVTFINKKFMLKIEGVSDIGPIEIERGVEPKPSCMMETPQFRVATRVFEKFPGVKEISFNGVFMHIQMAPEAPIDGIIDEMTIVLKESLKSVAFIHKQFMLKVKGVSDISSIEIKRGVDLKLPCMMETPQFRVATRVFEKFPGVNGVSFVGGGYVFIEMAPEAPTDGIIEEMTSLLENLKTS